MNGSPGMTKASLKAKILPAVLKTTTVRRPGFLYVWVCATAEIGQQREIDEITARNYLTSALTEFLGLAGSAISTDILKCEGRDLWIRVPQEDGSAVVEALSNYYQGWYVKASGAWLGGLAMDGGRGLFL